MLLTARFILSAEWPEGFDGRYYWEHCLWVDDSDWDSHIQMFLGILSDMKLLYTSQVDMHAVRFYDPSDMSLVYSQGIGPGNHGSQSPVEVVSLLIVARWTMRGADGSHTYHLHRAPVGVEYLTDGVWNLAGYAEMQTRLNTFIAQDVYRTKTGSLITEGFVGPYPGMWQLRHGTKRRESRFWLT